VKQRASSDKYLTARARFQLAVKKVTEQRLRKLRNGVRIKLAGSKSMDENEFEELVRIPL
jgi:hypothetical protein